jgi:hypothetical protein
MHTSPIARMLSFVAPGPEVVFQNLAMIPLLPRRRADGVEQVFSPNGAAYVVLDEALAAGEVEITEISEMGRVPELLVRNRGARPTLIVDGEELLGAKQNRVVNLSILVAGRTDLPIPVSCVEAGRWRARSRSFASAPRTQYATGRAKRMADVTASMRLEGNRLSDQSSVWADIAEKSARLRANSPTGAMEAIFTQHASFMDSCVNALRPVDDQVGALFAIGERLVGLDLFDAPSTLRKLLPKLARSVAVDALDEQATHVRPGSRPEGVSGPFVRPPAEWFLSAVSDSPYHSAPAVGIGEDLRLTANGISGGALLAEGRIVHLSAFTM